MHVGDGFPVPRPQGAGAGTHHGRGEHRSSTGNGTFSDFPKGNMRLCACGKVFFKQNARPHPYLPEEE